MSQTSAGSTRTDQDQPRVRDYASGLGRTILTGTARLVSNGSARIADISQPRQLGHSALAHWTIPPQLRRPFPFTQGDLAQIHNSLSRAEAKLPGAAVAILHYLHSHQPDRTDQTREYELARAGGRYVQLIRIHEPTNTSLIVSRYQQEEARLSVIELDRLTGDLGFFEDQYLRHVTGQKTEISIQRLIWAISGVADRFEALGKQGRPAFARAMVADLCLMWGYFCQSTGKPNFQEYFDTATRNMARALQLMGEKYPDLDQELMRISQSASISSSQGQPSASGQSTAQFGQPVGVGAEAPSGPPPVPPRHTTSN